PESHGTPPFDTVHVTDIMAEHRRHISDEALPRLIDMRAQTEVPSARQPDTPLQVTPGDVTCAPTTTALTSFGGPDRSARRALSISAAGAVRATGARAERRTSRRGEARARRGHAPGAQARRRGEAGPVRVLLGSGHAPAAFINAPRLSPPAHHKQVVKS